MMNLDNYYMHATGGYDGEFNYKNRIIDILREGKVKASEISKNYDGISPRDSICLCDTTRPVVYDRNGDTLFSSYEHFILNSPSLLFSRDLKIKIPEYDNYYETQAWNSNKSDCYDEVRYYGDLTLEKLKVITFPIFKEKTDEQSDKYEEMYKIQELQIFRENINIISKEFSLIQIKDIYTGKNITVNDVDRQIEVYQKKIK